MSLTPEQPQYDLPGELWNQSECWHPLLTDVEVKLSVSWLGLLSSIYSSKFSRLGRQLIADGDEKYKKVGFVIKKEREVLVAVFKI